MKPVSILFLIVISMNSRAATISQGSYEDDLVIQLVKQHTDGGVVWLGSGSNTFLSLFQDTASRDTRRAVIILHGMGMHADWPELVSPLRRALPASGWASLSVQLPILEPGTGQAEYGELFVPANERIRMAVLYLQDKGFDEIVLLGYSFGATNAVNYLSNYKSTVKALVGISMQPHPFLKPRFDLIDELSRIDIPVLDIYAGKDFSGVLKSADDRRLAARKGQNTVYQQELISGTGHYYNGEDARLVQAITSWLDQVLKPETENP